MENQHEKISGYRALSQEEIGVVNRLKALEKEVLSVQAKVVEYLKAQEQSIKAGIARRVDHGTTDSEGCRDLMNRLNQFNAGEPLRWAAIGKTDIQTGFMALVRAVTRPE